MSVVNPEDRAKVGILVAAVVVVFGAIAWQLMANASGPEVQVAGPEPIRMDEAAAEPLGSKENLIELPALQASAAVDPFRSVLKSAGTSAPSGSMGGASAQVPSSEFGGTYPERPLLPGVDGVATAPETLGLGMRLDGVIAGSPSVAVIQIGGESFVLRVGDRFGDGLSVVAIRDSSVVIGKGKVRTTLSIGHPASSR